MTNEGNVPKERALVEVSPETKALVDEQMPNETQQVKNENNGADRSGEEKGAGRGAEGAG